MHEIPYSSKQSGRMENDAIQNNEKRKYFVQNAIILNFFKKY